VVAAVDPPAGAATETGSAVSATAPAASDRNAVSRVVAVLEALARADDRGVGIRDLAAQTGISRSAVHRLLAQLVELGFASGLPKDRYEAGPQALAWTVPLGTTFTIADAARDALERLARELNESAYAVSYDAEQHAIVFVGAAHTTKPVQYVLELQSQAPLHAGAAGKAVLAWLPDEEVERLELARHTDTTIVDLAALRSDLAETRARGYALSEGERIADASGIAAPVFRDGQVCGAITLTVPRYRFDPALRDTYAAAVRAAGSATTRLLTADPDQLPPEPEESTAPTLG
jgi:DNA-binding IclR family transcriptional regulator